MGIPLAEFENPKALTSKLVRIAAAGGISLKTNKGLAGGSGAWASQNTSYNPAARQAGALLTVGGINQIFPQLLDKEANQKMEQKIDGESAAINTVGDVSVNFRREFWLVH